MNRRLYALHRWLSLIALVQLAIWATSGLFFAAVPMTRVKGRPVEGANVYPVATDGLVPIDAILRDRAREGKVERIELVGTGRGPMYRGKVGKRRFRLDARSGEERPVDAAEGEEIARHDQPGGPAVRTTERIEREPLVEYRGRPLPAWRARSRSDAARTAPPRDGVMPTPSRNADAALISPAGRAATVRQS